MTEKRNSGIDLIGYIPWGTHFCQFYETPKDLTEILVPYFKAGLEGNEYCIWVTSEPLDEKSAKEAIGKAMPDFDRYLEKGQIDIVPHDQWYLKGGVFDLQKVLDSWIDRLDHALKQGYDGFRVTGNTAWLEKNDWKSFTEYEAEIHRVIGNYRMIAICTYSLDRCSAADVIDVVNNHQFALIRRQSQWQLMESTEHKQAKEALRESEERYRSLFKNMLNGYAFCKMLLDEENKPVDFIYIDVNDAFEKLTGLRKEDVIGKRVTEAIPNIKALNPGIIPIYGEVAVTGKPTSFEVFFKPLDIWLTISVYSPQKDYFVAVFDNITERKQAEEQLRLNEARYKSLVSILQYKAESIQGFLDYALGEAIKLTGSKIGYIYYYHEDKKEFVLNTWSKDVMKECTIQEPPTVYQLDKTGIWGEAVRQGKPIVVNDFQAYHPLKKGYPEGHSRLIKYMTVPIYSDGIIVAVVGVANKETDYTSIDVLQLTLLMDAVWKNTELKRAEEKSQTIIRTSMDGFLLVDTQARFLDVNDAYCHLIGYSRDELLTMKVSEVEEAESPEETAEHIRRMVEVGHDQFETRHRCKDGRVVDIEVSINHMGGEDGVFFVFLRDITERKQAEEALKESEERYRSLVNLGAEVGEAVVMLQDEGPKEGVQVFCNETWPCITGYSDKELLNMSFFDLVHPKDRENSLKRHRSKMSGISMPGLFEITIIRKDGTEIHVEATSAYTTYQGKPANVAYIRNITKRKQQEKVREFTRSLLEIANLGRQMNPTLKEFVRVIRNYAGCDAVGIRILDSEGNIPYQAYAGFSREFYESESLLSIKLHHCMCINVIKGDTDLSLPYYTEDGSLYMNGTTAFLAAVSEEEKGSMRNVCNAHGYESVALVPIRLGDSILGLIHIADKRTDMVPLDLVNTLEDAAPQIGLSIRRLWTEQELAEEKERLEVTLRSTGDGIIAVDMEGKVVLLNRAAEELSGWTQKEAVGRSIREVFYIIDERNRQPIPDPIENVVKTGRVIGLVNHALLISRDGTESVIADSGAPIHDEHGRMFGVVLVFRDITELRRLQEEQLKIAKLESIGILAGGIAHDFNNLLTAIMGNIGLAKRYVEPQGKAFERLDEAEKASVRAKDLTQQLLTFSKGGAPIKKTAVISELVKETAAFALSGSDVRLELSLPEDLWAVEVDEGQMSQVIQNIVINADEAMPAGGTLHISARNTAIQRLGALPLPKGNYLQIDIKDEGIGMSPKQLARIFEPYYTTKQKGSGLGLATAYSIINNHGGYITAESAQNVGTTFHIYLPASSKLAPVEKKPAREKPVRGKGRILVMDDEELIRLLLRKILTGAGYKVELTKDGTEAVQLYRKARESEQPFDAVILDLTVPGGMGGEETVKKLLEINPHAKVIVSSGYATDPIMSEYKKYGFRAVVTKPYNVAQMEETLHDVLAGKE